MRLHTQMSINLCMYIYIYAYTCICRHSDFDLREAPGGKEPGSFSQETLETLRTIWILSGVYSLGPVGVLEISFKRGS